MELIAEITNLIKNRVDDDLAQAYLIKWLVNGDTQFLELYAELSAKREPKLAMAMCIAVYITHKATEKAHESCAN